MPALPQLRAARRGGAKGAWRACEGVRGAESACCRMGWQDALGASLEKPATRPLTPPTDFPSSREAFKLLAARLAHSIQPPPAAAAAAGPLPAASNSANSAQ